MTGTLTATLTEEMTEVGSPDLDLSIEDLDLNLERIVRVHEGSERLICEYLVAIRERRGYERFGFIDIYRFTRIRVGKF